MKKFTKRDMLITILPHKYNEMSFISNIYFRSGTKISLFSTTLNRRYESVKFVEISTSSNWLYLLKQNLEYLTLQYNFDIHILFRLTIKKLWLITKKIHILMFLREVCTLHQLMSKTEDCSLVSILGFLYI